MQKLRKGEIIVLVLLATCLSLGLILEAHSNEQRTMPLSSTTNLWTDILCHRYHFTIFFSLLAQVNSHNITLSVSHFLFSAFDFDHLIANCSSIRYKICEGQWWPHRCFSHRPLVLLYSAEELTEFLVLLHFTDSSIVWRASECKLLERKRRKLKTLHRHLHLRKLQRSMALKLDFGRCPFQFFSSILAYLRV